MEVRYLRNNVTMESLEIEWDEDDSSGESSDVESVCHSCFFCESSCSFQTLKNGSLPDSSMSGISIVFDNLRVTL